MSVTFNIIIVAGVVCGLYLLHKKGYLGADAPDKVSMYAGMNADNSGDSGYAPSFFSGTQDDADPSNDLTAVYGGAYQNVPSQYDDTIDEPDRELELNKDYVDDNATRDGDPLPAPVFAVDSVQTLQDVYGSNYNADAASAGEQFTGPPEMPLPMVADTYQAAPLGGGYGSSPVNQDMMKSSCRAACASKSTPRERNDCTTACQSKSLGMDVTTYNNAVDFLRPLLPIQQLKDDPANYSRDF